ncbi:MAG TPA: hypothetical protein VKA38_14600, partial [Draconibacterium sp.]|nr:hypothetical protein [Draconibacterium sp.]
MQLRSLILTMVLSFQMLWGSSTPLRADQKQPADYVNPFVGTEFFGHTFPGASLPFAMVHLSPDV